MKPTEKEIRVALTAFAIAYDGLIDVPRMKAMEAALTAAYAVREGEDE